MPRASIVIPSRGGAARLPVLFRALQGQTTTDWEAVVVLDGDVDGSAQVVEEWSAAIPVRAIVFPDNRGRSAALNAGFRVAVGEVLIRCDDDLEPAPDFVELHSNAHEGGSGGVVGLCRNVFSPTPYAKVYGQPVDIAARAGAYSGSGREPWAYWAANASVRREVYDSVGDYDTDFRAYGWEDVDWGYRLNLAGYDVVVRQDLEVLHHGAAVSTVSRCQRAYHSGRARRTFESKHGASALGLGEAPSGAWGRAVSFLARILTPQRLRLLAGSVDRLLPLTPAITGRKMVALLVEAAAMAGHSAKSRNEVVF